MAILAGKNLTVSYYGDIDILKDVSIHADEGLITTIIGPNGAGKSTLLKALYGLLKPKKGSVFLKDKDITHLKVHEFIKKGIAYVPQLRSIFPDLTVFENLELKQQLFADLDKQCSSDVILCSNTSVISITEIAERAEHRERIVGTHFWNPPYLIPLVEVVRAEESADWCITATYELLERVGKHPVHVHKDVPGFVGNRLQHALWREAFAIIAEGICDPAPVDEVIRNGFGLRLPVLGQVETADMVGLYLTLAIHNYILKYINADPAPSTTLKTNVDAGDLGFKSGKGFLEWTEFEIEASRKKLANYLINVFAEQQKLAKGGQEEKSI